MYFLFLARSFVKESSGNVGIVLCLAMVIVALMIAGSSEPVDLTPNPWRL